MALDRRGGVARWTTLSGDGVSQRALAGAVESRAVRRIGRGTYALPDANDAHITAVYANAYLSHTTAAAYWGIDLLEPAGVHLAIPKNTRRRFQDAFIHRVDLAREDVTTELVPATTAVRTLLDCARSLPFREALVIADSALRKGLTDEATLRAAAARVRGRAEKVLRAATMSAGSVAESLLRSIFYVDRRLPEPEVQFEVRSAGKLIAQLDLAVPIYRGRIVNLGVEVDGYEFHSSRADYRRDRYRRNELARRGWGHLAVTYEDAKDNRRYVAALIHDTLEIRWASAARAKPASSV